MRKIYFKYLSEIDTMKKIFNWIWNSIKFIWYTFPKYVIYAIILAFLGGLTARLITHDTYYQNMVAAIIFFGILGCVILYVWGKQLWEWFTSKNTKK
jgi:hypothetical protein